MNSTSMSSSSRRGLLRPAPASSHAAGLESPYRLDGHAEADTDHRARRSATEDATMNVMRNAQYQHIETHRIAGSLGAEVSGVDLAEDLPDEVLGEVRAALLENQVIFFRDQNLSP